jgi:hypothetical protein
MKSGKSARLRRAQTRRDNIASSSSQMQLSDICLGETNLLISQPFPCQICCVDAVHREVGELCPSQRFLKMPICIECRYPVKTLYTEYSGADDKSTGHGVRLTVCKNCGRFCDKYVEHDFVVLFIDLILIKPQVCHSIRYVLVSC